MEGKDFRLAKEIKYIQRQAAEHDGCFVTIGPLAFFSTETGDAWMLEPSNQLAARLARDGAPEPIDIEETDTNYAIGWKGNYRIEGRHTRRAAQPAFGGSGGFLVICVAPDGEVPVSRQVFSKNMELGVPRNLHGDNGSAGPPDYQF